MKVLVTGFYDWAQLPGAEAAVDPFQCRFNSSGLLILEGSGPLAQRLVRDFPQISWEFRVFPVIWGQTLPPREEWSRWDVVVSLGVRSRDRDPEIHLENGAINLRKTGSRDARGVEAPTPKVDDAAPEGAVLLPAVEGRARDWSQSGVYSVKTVQARESNSYLCNETHYRWLQACRSGEGRPKVAFFIHIPHTPDRLSELSEALSGVICGLLNL